MDDFGIQKISGAAVPQVREVTSARVKADLKEEEKSSESTAKKPSEDLENLVAEAQKRIQLNNTSLEFKIDEQADTPVVVVTDKESGKVIRQIPSEEMLRLRHRMADLVGLIYNGSV